MSSSLVGGLPVMIILSRNCIWIPMFGAWHDYGFILAVRRQGLAGHRKRRLEE